jgi:gamma-glutamylcysteine synthetase
VLQAFFDLVCSQPCAAFDICLTTMFSKASNHHHLPLMDACCALRLDVHQQGNMLGRMSAAAALYREALAFSSNSSTCVPQAEPPC